MIRNQKICGEIRGWTSMIKTSPIDLIKEYIKIGKKLGLKSIKVGDIEIEFIEKNIKAMALSKKQLQGLTLADIPKHEMPTEQDFLYMSSDYDPSENKDKPELTP